MLQIKKSVQERITGPFNGFKANYFSTSSTWDSDELHLLHSMTRGKGAWCWRRHDHTAALPSQISGAPFGCQQCCCCLKSRCRDRGAFLQLVHTQMEAVVDYDHLRKSPRKASDLPLEMKHNVKQHNGSFVCDLSDSLIHQKEGQFCFAQLALKWSSNAR